MPPLELAPPEPPASLDRVELVRVRFPALSMAPPFPPGPPAPATELGGPPVSPVNIDEPIDAVPLVKMPPPLPEPAFPKPPVFDENVLPVMVSIPLLQIPPPSPAAGNGASPWDPPDPEVLDSTVEPVRVTEAP